MNTPQDLERKFWSALKSDMTMMLGLVDVEDGHARPMTAQLEGEQRGPIWFFSATDASNPSGVRDRSTLPPRSSSLSAR